MLPRSNTAQKMKFFTKDLFSKCDQIHRKLRIWSHLLKKSLMENFRFFCSVMGNKLLVDRMLAGKKVWYINETLSIFMQSPDSIFSRFSDNFI